VENRSLSKPFGDGASRTEFWSLFSGPDKSSATLFGPWGRKSGAFRILLIPEDLERTNQIINAQYDKQGTLWYEAQRHGCGAEEDTKGL
jgi:hypothetical protein